jgi:hypothetical protein
LADFKIVALNWINGQNDAESGLMGKTTPKMDITTPKMNQWAIQRREWINGQNDAENRLMGKTTP